MQIPSAAESEFGKIDVIPSGLPQLDRLLGIGGYPRRRMVQISGKAGLGKSTIALHAVAAAQQQKFKVLYVDADYKLSLPYAEALGVDINKLLFLQHPIGTTLLEEVETIIENGKIDFVVIDPVSAILPREELESPYDATIIGKQALLIQRFVRHMKSVLSIANTSMLFLNHERPDFMNQNELKVAGGKALLEAIAIWVRLKASGKKLMMGDKQVGKIITAFIYQKNQLAATEGQSCDLEILFGSGFQANADILQDALDKGVITKEGNTYFFEGEKLAVGYNKLRETLKDATLVEKIKTVLHEIS